MVLLDIPAFHRVASARERALTAVVLTTITAGFSTAILNIEILACRSGFAQSSRPQKSRVIELSNTSFLHQVIQIQWPSGHSHTHLEIFT
jgi:hypothetical protein